MRDAGQHQRRMDLVRDDPCPVSHHDVPDPLKLGPAEHPAPRVVRLGQQQGPGAGRQDRVEPVQVDLGTRGVGVDDEVDPLPAGHLRNGELG